ncbi:MAG: hypothetical protein K9N35_06085 [Candidatus Marinimicrobia bacterium]|nr:hypothetical protein [Candidatus Neomarinimicrobiota bacterium]
MITSKFNSDRNILETRFFGEVTLKEIIDYIDATRLNRDYPRYLKILTDGLESFMNFPGEALPKIVEANNRSLEKYDAIVDAIILDSPRETALSIFYEELSKAPKYRFKVFSTKRAAIEWLDSFKDPKL